MMITTTNQYRQAIRNCPSHSRENNLPPFSLPKDSEQYQSTIHASEALKNLEGARAGFIGRTTAALVHKVL